MKRCNTSQGFGTFFVQSSCDRFLFPFSLFSHFLPFFLDFFLNSGEVFNKTIILLGLAGYQMIITNEARYLSFDIQRALVE